MNSLLLRLTTWPLVLLASLLLTDTERGETPAPDPYGGDYPPSTEWTPTQIQRASGYTQPVWDSAIEESAN